MRIIQQQVQTWGYCPDTVEGTINWIEQAARVCYQSQDRIGDGSAEKMVRGLIKKEHTAMLEHSWIAFSYAPASLVPAFDIVNDPFIHMEKYQGRMYVMGNYRSWFNHFKMFDGVNLSADDFDTFHDIHELIYDLFQNRMNIDIQLESNEFLPIKFRPITTQFITSRDVTHELVRHRPFMAYAQKSQRYCADKDNVDFVLPSWALPRLDIMYKIDEKVYNTMEWMQSMKDAEDHYHELLKTRSAQEARVVLPNSCATEIVVTAPMWQWQWVDHLRTSAAAYPAIRELISIAQEQRDALIATT